MGPGPNSHSRAGTRRRGVGSVWGYPHIFYPLEGENIEIHAVKLFRLLQTLEWNL